MEEFKTIVATDVVVDETNKHFDGDDFTEQKKKNTQSVTNIKPDLKLLTILEIMDMFNISYYQYAVDREKWHIDYTFKKNKY